jgi:phage terminase Nu1 subunit (DNA packaging protein)
MEKMLKEQRNTYERARYATKGRTRKKLTREQNDRRNMLARERRAKKIRTKLESNELICYAYKPAALEKMCIQ